MRNDLEKNIIPLNLFFDVCPLDAKSIGELYTLYIHKWCRLKYEHQIPSVQNYKNISCRDEMETYRLLKYFDNDNEGEWTYKKFSKYLIVFGIIHQLTISLSNQQNGELKECNHIIIKKRLYLCYSLVSYPNPFEMNIKNYYLFDCLWRVPCILLSYPWHQRIKSF